MRNATGLALAAVTTALAAMALTPTAAISAAPETVPALVIEQEVGGIPGMPPGAVSRQRIALDAAGGRLVLEAVPEGESSAPGTREKTPDKTSRPTANVGLTESGINRVVLRLDEDPRRITEISDARKFFQTRELTQLSKLQEDRDVMEASIIQFAKRRSQAERDKILERSFLRPDGRREVAVTYGGERTILGQNCREVRVTENGRLIIHAWMATDLDVGSTFYELYQGLGALSREVLEKVRDLEGLPLEAKIRVVTAAPSYVLVARSTKITKQELSIERFDIPKDYREIVKQQGIVPCPICANDVEWDEPGGGIHIHPFTQKEYRTCSKKCQTEMKARLRKERERVLGR